MKDRVALVLTAAVAAFHLAFANRYDLFRDELYFIVCGRHPAFGYVDQPPLVPLMAAGTYALGAQTWLVRLPAVAAAAALVWLVVALIRLLGGRDGAAWMGGAAVGFAPMLMGLTATLNTTTFEPLVWTFVVYALARAALRDDRRAPVWAGIAAGLAMEAKYALPLWLLALAIGLTMFPERHVLRRRDVWIGIAIAVVLALPSLVWQAVHGWPFAEIVRNAHTKDLAVAPAAYALNQLLVFNPPFAAIWLSGLAAPFVLRDLRALRFIPVAYALTAAAIVLSGGKDYYLAPAYPSLFALGAVALERGVRNAALRAAYLIPALGVALVLAPLALPILAPDRLAAYERRLHLAPQAQEHGDSGDAIPPAFSDMLGWHTFVAQVGAAYDALPPRERADTAIVLDNYGEAAAIDLYGSPYGLPPALSGHNAYFSWGLRGQHPHDLLRIRFHPEALRPYCGELRIMGTTHAAFARDFENGRAIAFCRDVDPPLRTIWPKLRVFI